MSTIKDFSGGLNTRAHPQLIKANSSVEYTNCENEEGILKPTKSPTVTTISSDNWWVHFKEENTVVSSPSETYYAEFDRFLYYTDSTGMYKRDSSGNISDVGIDGPSNTLTPSDAGAGNLDGTYKYVYTYYDNSTGVESSPSLLSTELVVVNRKILVSGIVVSTDPQVTHIRLYRIGGILPNYSLVTTLPNISASYTDNNSDTSIAENEVLESFDRDKPPSGATYLTESNAMLFASVGSKLYFSDVALPDAWAAFNYLEFTQEITGIGEVQNGLLVFTRYYTYIVTGTSPSTLARFLISKEQGCVNHSTIVFANNTLTWLSTDGICTSNGGSITVVTQQLLGRLSIPNSINASVFDRMYFLSYGNETLIVDTRYGFSIRKLGYGGMYGVFNDELYYQDSGHLLKMFDGSPDTFTYKSPLFSEGRLSEYKSFKDIYIAFKGEIKVDIELYNHQDILPINVFSETLQAGQVEQDLKIRGNEVGYGIQFTIEGTGEVHEIDFKAVGRENGK